MKAPTLLIILLTFVSAKAQTQGDHEKVLAEKYFETKYKPQLHNRYIGKVLVVNENMFKYDEEILLVYNTNKDYKVIFENGTLYPALITGDVEKGLVRKEDLKSMVFRNDSLRISNFHELTFLEKTPKVKRFEFWLFFKGFANPTVYFVELTNKNATRRTSLFEFLKNARLTFFEKAWMTL